MIFKTHITRLPFNCQLFVSLPLPKIIYFCVLWLCWLKLDDQLELMFVNTLMCFQDFFLSIAKKGFTPLLCKGGVQNGGFVSVFLRSFLHSLEPKTYTMDSLFSSFCYFLSCSSNVKYLNAVCLPLLKIVQAKWFYYIPLGLVDVEANFLGKCIYFCFF